MALTASAVADLRFCLRFVAHRYRSYATKEDAADNAGLYVMLADERQGDADLLGRVADGSGVAADNPVINDGTAGPLLGMGVGDPNTPVSVAYRVQRAENTLARMAAQLRSLTPTGRLRDALTSIRDHIHHRRDGVRAARYRAQRLDQDGESFARCAGSARADLQEVEVWFGTNRQRNARSRFPGERSDNISYGRCRVFVPEDRAMGSLGRGLFGRIIKGDNRVKLQHVDVLEEHEFWFHLADSVTNLDTGDRQGLIFLHGFNTKFEDAARRTAQLKVDLAHKGPAAFFSWPSLGYGAGYSGDESAIDGSEPAIRAFLVDFAQRSGVSAVHIIAHSMGNRGLLRAMDAIAGAAASAAPVRFGQVFLAAPDVDATVFRNLAAAYGKLCTRTTLYVTNNDKAIGLSRILHRYARVGLSPPVAVVPGVDTVDASGVNLGLIGHGYAAEMRPVLADIHELIKGDTAPSRRFGLRKALGGTADYWEFKR